MRVPWLCRGKPLREVNPGRTGRAWRRPSPSTDIKAAALRTLCQALVPDNHRANITQVCVGCAAYAALDCLSPAGASAAQLLRLGPHRPLLAPANHLTAC